MDGKKNEINLIETVVDKITHYENLVKRINKEDINPTFNDYFSSCDNEIIDVLNLCSRPLIESLGKNFGITTPKQLNRLVTYLQYSYFFDANREENVEKLLKEFDASINSCLLLSVLMKIRKQEAKEDYQFTAYHQFITLLFESMKRNGSTKNAYDLVLKEMDVFFKNLSLEAKGNLAIEHYIIDHNRHRTIYFQFMALVGDLSKVQMRKNNAFYYTIFRDILLTLGERLRNPINQEKLLEAICATEFYKTNLEEKEKQFNK